MQKIKVGVYGATGYTGLELVRLLEQHPAVEIGFLTSESQAGRSLQSSWAQAPDVPLISASQAASGMVDQVFLCLPHTQSASQAAEAIRAGVKVIDLSADLRLDDPAIYQTWYQVEHPEPDLLPVPYGLPEIDRSQLAGAQCIANPGCYATAVLLGLTPLVQKGWITNTFPVIIDAKSGVTGAGRSPKQNLMFGEVYANFSPYNIGRNHRHLAEIEQELARRGFPAGQIIFSPHLLPTDRGILAAIYVQGQDNSNARAIFEQQYHNEPFIRMLPAGELATLGHVVRTPLAAVSLTSVNEKFLIVMVAIDNLLKGAASQAVQNFNLQWGLPETTGLLTLGETQYG
jgi:N-acetyl-gamma-glutamyl-phosphate reductase